jgi:enoyl-CoA hydratase
MTGAVHLKRDGVIAHVIFDRPEARNAMTWAMYEELGSICDHIRADPTIRVATFRGVGQSFVAGTDIQQFVDFKRSLTDGVSAVDWPLRHAAICALRRQQRHLVFP